MSDSKKRFGQFFTPPEVAQTLVRWVIANPRQRLLDPSCGDGEFLVCHRRAVGIDVDREHTLRARTRAPAALVHEGDFFLWASRTSERFDAAAGNPPFIRYQSFSGETRERAISEAAKLGAQFNRLSSSWAPFLVATARLLRPGASMAFVVPAELGHATYAEPLLESLCRHFERVHVVAFREKLFPALSEDCWLLHCAGFGGQTSELMLSALEKFCPLDRPPDIVRLVSLTAWRNSGCRLRRFLLPERGIALYDALTGLPGVSLFSQVGHAGVGYVTGANDFFHLRPSEARTLRIPHDVLRVAVRRGEQLPERSVDQQTVRKWLDDDERVLLLHLRGVDPLPKCIRKYLDTEAGQEAKKTYKCRNRTPWYVVPDVKTPDAFLSYMSGVAPALVANRASCVCTNSVHAVRICPNADFTRIQRAWETPLCQLSCEIEGHPLGGGMLKLEPGEAAKVRLPLGDVHLSPADTALLQQTITEARRWRHYV